MATDRALAHAYRQIKGQLRYQEDHDLAAELSDLCEELALRVQDEDLRWQLREHVEAERWVVVREGSNDPQVVIAKAKGGLDREGGFLVGPSEWAGYYYDKGQHYDTAEAAQKVALEERARRIAQFERERDYATSRLMKAQEREVIVSDAVWEYGEWDE